MISSSFRPSFATTSTAFFVALGLLGVAWTPGCADPDEGAVAIATEGMHSLRVGQSMTLAASTLRGTDHAYTWSSPDASIATVSADGVVTGVAPGEVVLEVTGQDTGAVGEHVIVVLAAEGTGTTGPADTDGTSTGGSTDTDGTSTGDSTDTGNTSSGGDEGPTVPFYDQWLMSAHADASAQAFTHWDEDGEIPTQCAKCHSREGFADYLGDDGSEVGVVNQPAPTGSVVDCATCHSEAANALSVVTFPSGVTVEALGPEARCMTCHQGRGSTDSVDATITAAAVGDDEVSAALGFENIHFFPAAATLFAGQVRGGYQYAEQVYDRRFRHVPEFNTCTDCHDPHTTRPRVDACAECHPGVTQISDLHDVRMIASLNVDYDGDGDTSVGVYHEVEGLKTKLYAAIQRYASEVVGQTICYSPGEYPYFFRSASGASAECTAQEATYDNRFDQWSPRLVRAAYNYQMARKDPGAYVHNSRYIIKLLHDSITDLNAVISSPVDMSAAQRNATGHFDGASRAARYWDDNEVISPSCSKCHSGEAGFRFWVEYGVGLEVPETANGLECYTCHESFGNTYDVLEVTSTTYADGTTIAHQGFDNLCSTCHGGRQTGATIDAAIAAGTLGFRNVHDLPSAGVRNGSTSGVGYEYPGLVYEGYLQHGSMTQCTGCHDPVASNHTFRIQDVWDARCDVCHSDDGAPEQIRIAHLEDYDGDGNTSELLRDELQGMADQLLVTIVVSAASPLCYSSTRFPYFIGQLGNASGHCPDGASGSFPHWTPELMRAAHNYQLHAKDPGAYAHNFDYVGQLLYDSIEDLGGDVTGLVRP